MCSIHKGKHFTRITVKGNYEVQRVHFCSELAIMYQYNIFAVNTIAVNTTFFAVKYYCCLYNIFAVLIAEQFPDDQMSYVYSSSISTLFTEYCQTWLRHWRLDNSIIQRGVTSDNRSRPLALFPKTLCSVSSCRGASIDVFRSESENAKYFTVVAELPHLPLYIIQYLAQQMHFSSGVQSLLSQGSYALPLLTVTNNKN